MSKFVIIEDQHMLREDSVQMEVIDYNHNSPPSPILEVVTLSPSTYENDDARSPSPLSTQRGDEIPSSPTSSQREDGDGQEDVNVELRPKMDVSTVRFYTPNMESLKEILDDLPDFAQGKKLSWFQRDDQADIDVAWMETNDAGDNELVNLRRTPVTRVWKNMLEFGNLIFSDSDELLQHARSWPIPIGYFRDYTVMWGNAKGLMRIYG